METSNQNQLITTLHQGLQQTRSQQTRLLARLQEIDREAEALRQEYEDLEKFAVQTEEAIFNLVGKSRGAKSKGAPGYPQTNGFDEEFQADSRTLAQNYVPPPKPAAGGFSNGAGAGGFDNKISYIGNAAGNGQNVRPHQPMRFAENEPSSQRFADRTITQACTLLLREASRPMHVNELYQFLMDGGFIFNGNNPTISIAVSLNRNRRFNKVAPGTFDLVMRDASQAIS